MAREPRSEGERHTGAYLRQRRIRFDYEPDMGGCNIDFVAHTPHGLVAMEVYEPHLRLPNVAGSFDSVAPLLGLFKQAKLRQVRAAKRAGLPMILVLGSANSDISFDEYAAESVMFGRVGVRIPLDSADPAAEAEWTFLNGGRLQPSLNRGVSALALLRIFNPTRWRLDAAWRAGSLEFEPTMSRRSVAQIAMRRAAIELELAERGIYDPAASLARLVLFHNPFATNRLDRRFGGPHDDQHALYEERGNSALWGVVACGVRRWEVPD